MKTDTQKSNGAVVQIEIEITKLESLFVTGELCAADFRCLDLKSKNLVRNLCLKSCANSIRCYRDGIRACPACVNSVPSLGSFSSMSLHYDVSLLAECE